MEDLDLIFVLALSSFDFFAVLAVLCLLEEGRDCIIEIIELKSEGEGFLGLVQ